MKRLAVLIALLILVNSSPALISTHAQSSRNFSVNTPLDRADANIGDGVCQTAVPNQCTLRAAIQEGNVFAGQTFIGVNNAGGPMGLSVAGASEDNAATGDLDIISDIQIGGPGTVDGNDLDRVFHVHSGGHLDVLAVHVTDGNVLGAEDGGAILVSGAGSTLEFTFAQISASQSADRGGAVRVESGAFAEIRSVSIAQNTAAGPGGGISVFNAGLSLKNTTIYNNTVGSGSGGGIAIQNDSADLTVGPALKVVTLNNVTIADNDATNLGGGLVNFEDINPAVSNTVFSNNVSANSSQCGFSGADTTAAMLSMGNNLISNNAGCTGFIITDIVNQSAGLAAAAPINGITHLKPASSASAVVNKGGTFSCEPGDSVGNLRPQGSGCDIGAIELAVGFAGSISATPIVSIGQTVTVTLQDADLRFTSSVDVTAQTIVNGVVFEIETLTLEDVNFNETFTATFPVQLNSVPDVGNGVLDIVGEGMIRFSYNDSPNGVSEAGATSRTFETQVSGLQDDLIVNSSFELDGNGDKVPDSWRGINLSKDKQLCNNINKTFAVDGLCAFQMKDPSGVMSQKVTLPLPSGIDDDMFLEILVDTKVARPGILARIVIKESDGDTEKCQINLLAGTNAGAGGYEAFQCNVEPDLDEVISIKVTISTPTGGKVLFDRVSLLTITPRERTAVTRAPDGLLPPPDAPAGFRR
jgi:hypothetical protein